MSGEKLVDYNQVREGRSTAHLYITKAAVNYKLERIAALVESGPLSANAAKTLAAWIRGMKERAL